MYDHPATENERSVPAKVAGGEASSAQAWFMAAVGAAAVLATAASAVPSSRPPKFAPLTCCARNADGTPMVARPQPTSWTDDPWRPYPKQTW